MNDDIIHSKQASAAPPPVPSIHQHHTSICVSAALSIGFLGTDLLWPTPIDTMRQRLAILPFSERRKKRMGAAFSNMAVRAPLFSSSFCLSFSLFLSRVFVFSHFLLIHIFPHPAPPFSSATHARSLFFCLSSSLFSPSLFRSFFASVPHHSLYVHHYLFIFIPNCDRCVSIAPL